MVSQIRKHGPSRIRYHHRVPPRPPNPFDIVERVGLTLPGVEISQRYDGVPVLTLEGVFLAGLASHESAERGTLVIRADPDERELFIQDAPDTYYLTDFYRRHPVVLVRLDRITPEIVRELLVSSRRLTLPKTRLRRPRAAVESAATDSVSTTGWAVGRVSRNRHSA